MVAPMNAAFLAESCHGTRQARPLVENACLPAIALRLPEPTGSDSRRGTERARMSLNTWNVPISFRVPGTSGHALSRTRPRRIVCRRSVSRRAGNVRRTAEDVSRQRWHAARSRFYSGASQARASSTEGRH